MEESLWDTCLNILVLLTDIVKTGNTKIDICQNDCFSSSGIQPSKCKSSWIPTWSAIPGLDLIIVFLPLFTHPQEATGLTKHLEVLKLWRYEKTLLHSFWYFSKKSKNAKGDKEPLPLWGYLEFHEVAPSRTSTLVETRMQTLFPY